MFMDTIGPPSHRGHGSFRVWGSWGLGWLCEEGALLGSLPPRCDPATCCGPSILWVRNVTSPGADSSSATQAPHIVKQSPHFGSESV